MHGAPADADDPAEALIGELLAVEDVVDEPRLLGDLAGPLGEGLGREPVRRVVDEVAGERRGRRERTCPGEDGLALRGPGQRREDLDRGDRRRVRRDAAGPGVRGRERALGDGGELLAGARGQAEDDGSGPCEAADRAAGEAGELVSDVASADALENSGCGAPAARA